MIPMRAFVGRTLECGGHLLRCRLVPPALESGLRGPCRGAGTTKEARTCEVARRSYSANPSSDASSSPDPGLALGERVVKERPSLPMITWRTSVDSLTPHATTLTEPRHAWVESLDTVEGEKLGMVPLHPQVFGHFPRLDIMHQNVRWQQNWRVVDFKCKKTRAEKRGGGRKPWPQKGLGKARHGSSRAPQWVGGGTDHGPRGPQTRYYVLPFGTRLIGLCSALSARYAQDRIALVDSLDIPSTESQYLEEVADARGWGVSVLYVDDTDLMPESITVATHAKPGHTLMPLYGLNVYSILKHDTLVLTLPALERLEERIHTAARKLRHQPRWNEEKIVFFKGYREHD